MKQKNADGPLWMDLLLLALLILGIVAGMTFLLPI